MTDDLVQYLKKVGIVAGTAMTCFLLIQMVYAVLWTNSWARSSEPIMKAIAEERRERVEADREILHAMSQLSRDRIELVEILAAESVAERTRRARETRQRWLRDEADHR